MVEVRNFIERVEQERIDRITNLPSFGDSKRSTKEFLDFFEKNGIDVNNVRLYLNQELEGQVSDKKRTAIIEGMITLLSLNEGKQEIINEVLERGPFNSPRDLTKAIAEYIKSKMSYDAMTALFQTRSMQMSLDLKYIGKIPEKVVVNIFTILEGEGIDINNDMKEKLIKANESGEFTDELVFLLVNYYKHNDKIKFNNYHLKLFAGVLADLKTRVDVNNLPENFQKYIKKISDLVSGNDTQGLEDYFFSQFGNNKDFRNFIVGLFQEMGYTDLLSIGNVTEIGDMFEKVRTGVCRHYSIMMKEIYNEIVKKGEGIKFSGESEMLYVLNYDVKHAYNILMIDGEDSGQYLDVTSFIIGGELFKKASDIKNIKGEMWVKSGFDNSGNNIA